MSTYTPSLGLELITPGSQAGLWGNTTNNSLNLIDQAITGVTPISFASASGSTYTLTDYNGAEDESRAAVLNVIGTATGANTIVIPNKQKTYLVRNNTSQDVTFQTPSPTASYTVGAGYSILIFCDGNNNVFTGIASPGVGTLSVNAGGTGATTFTAGFVKSTGGTNALTSSATVNASSEVTGTLPVANGGTGAVSLTSGALLVGNGTGTVASLSGGVAGYVPTWNGSTWVSAAPGTAPVTSVFGRTGAVTASSSDYSSYYYPLTTNPSGYLTSSSLSGYATLSGTNTWTGSNSWSGATTHTQSSTWTGSGYTTTVGNTGISCGNANNSVNGDSAGTQLALYVGGSQRLQMYSTYSQFNTDICFGGSISTAPVALGTAGLRVGALTTSVTGSSTQIALGIGSTVFFLYNTGNATAPGTWQSLSDARLKENVSPVTSGLATIGKLNPIKFSMKKDGLDAPNRYGLLAQELELVVPEAVETTEAEFDGVENVKAVAYTELVPILIKAIQELKAEVDALKAAR